MKLYVLPKEGETKFQQFKREVRWRLQDGKEWVVEHKEELLVIVPAVVGGIATVTKVVGKHVNLRKEKAVKDLYCYDRSLGHYWALRRELSNKEWLEIDKRRKDGERLSDILAELNVLK